MGFEAVFLFFAVLFGFWHGCSSKFVNPSPSNKCLAGGSEIDVTISSIPSFPSVLSASLILKKSCKRILESSFVTSVDLQNLLGSEAFHTFFIEQRQLNFKWKLPPSLEITTYYFELWVLLPASVAHSPRKNIQKRLFTSEKFCISNCDLKILHEDIAPSSNEVPAEWPVGEDVKIQIGFPHRLMVDSYWRSAAKIWIAAVPKHKAPFYYRPLIRYCFVKELWIDGKSLAQTLTLTVNGMQTIYLSPLFRWTVQASFEGKWYEVAGLGDFEPVLTVLGLLQNEALRLLRNKLPLVCAD